MTSTPSSGEADGRPTGDRAVLVTGAAGFIGSHLCERLLERGYAVWGLDNFDPEYSPDQKRRNLRDAVDHPLMHLVEGDLRDSVLVNGLLRDQSFDAVVHLAAHRGSFPSRDDPRTCFDVNLMGTLELLEAMHRNRVRRLVFTSDLAGTGGERGEADGEWDAGDRPCLSNVSAGIFPAAKRSAELLSLVYHRSHGLSAHVLRLGPVYGPREAPDLPVRRLARVLRGRDETAPSADGGEPAPTPRLPATLPLLFIEDAVRGILASLDRLLAADDGEPSAFEVLDLHGDRPVAVEELKRRLASALGCGYGGDGESPPSGPDGQEPRAGADAGQPAEDGRRAREVLGVRPRVRLEEGLARFVEWLRTAPEPDGTAGPEPVTSAERTPPTEGDAGAVTPRAGPGSPGSP